MKRGCKPRVLLVCFIFFASLFIFTSQVNAPEVAPEILSTSPTNDETNVSIFANISVIFNKPMNTTSERWYIEPTVPLTSSWWNNTTLNLTHIVPFIGATNYRISITANSSGGAMLRHRHHTWRFTTTCGGPCIVETTPADGEINVAPTSLVIIRFSETPNLTSLTFTITPDVGSLTSSWDASFRTLSIYPTNDYEFCKVYIVDLVGGDLVPGPVPNPFSFTAACPGTSFINVADSKGFFNISGSFFAWGDYNRDGNEDLLINGKRLFRNNGPPNYDFTEVTTEAGIGGTSVNNGVWGDYNNDGWLDFYAPGGGWSTTATPDAPWDILWMNNGDGTFANVTAMAGYVKDIYPSVAAGWADYDRDGNIDLYVANYESATMSGYPDKLWHNEGNGTFTDVTSAAGIKDTGMSAKPGRGVGWGDYNNDGWQDIYISNYRITANYLWKNNGNGTFTDVAPATNSTGWLQTENKCPDYYLGGEWGKRYGHTIGSAWADFDNDGDLDVFSANLVHKYVGNTTWPSLPYDMRGYITDDSRFFRNDGPPDYNFSDIREASGMPLKPIWTNDWDLVGSSLAPCVQSGPVAGVVGDELFGNIMWTDYDLDGWQDMWLVQVYGTLDYSYSYLYHNNRDGTFSDVTTYANVRVWGGSYAGAWADYNNDGYPDLVTNGQYPNFGAPARIRLFENQGNNNSWLKVRLNGCTSNSAAIGARILATASGVTQMRNVEAGSGSHSQMNSLVQHFGFGSYDGTVDIEIRWPNGNIQTIPGVAVNQTLRVHEPGCNTPNRVEFINADLSDGVGSDLILDWGRVMGDDGWGSNVTEYAIYYATAHDSTASSYQYLGKVPAGSSIYTHIDGGRGDANTYYYAVQTNGTGGTIRSVAQAVKYTRPLDPGEQLVSIPVPISNYSIVRVLRGVTYTHLRIYDGRLSDPWLSYMPSRFYNDFAEFASYQAFWIGVTNQSNFTVAGPVLPWASLRLYAGWNLVGYHSTLPRTVADAVAGLGGNFQRMLSDDPLNSPYYLKELTLSDTMMVGEGYWILVGSDTDWTMSFEP